MSSGFLKQFAQIKPADIEWRETTTNHSIPFSKEFNDIYFNPQDGLAESKYVFLAGNNLPHDWKNLAQQQFNIAELGFGSGLNFLMTLNAWQQAINARTDKPRCHLNYISIEKRPFKQQDFLKAAKHWPLFSNLVEQLSTNYPSLTFGRHQIQFKHWNATLTLFFMPVELALNDLIAESRSQQNKIIIDHWYFDGFAPAKNQSMWEHSICEQVSRLSKIGTKLATFSVSKQVKSPLVKAGFKISKRKGFGRKREMLTAQLETPLQEKPKTYINLKYDKPWFNISHSRSAKNVAIIGAGIAGCATAYELANAGVKVHLFDQASTIAAKASGAAAGIFHPQLTADMNINSQFNWQAYCYLTHFLKSLTDEQKTSVILNQGIERVFSDSNEQEKLFALAEQIQLTDWITKPDHLLHKSSVFFPHAAAINLAQFCQLLINQIPEQNLQLFLGYTVKKITPIGAQWQVTTPQQNFVFDQLILCGGANSPLTEQYLQTQTNISRGQTCLLESKPITQQLTHTVCGKAYLVPQNKQQLLLGTTFENLVDDVLNQQSQNEVLKQASNLMQAMKLSFMPPEQYFNLPLKGSLGYRRHSQDRLPIVGAAFDNKKIEADFENLGQKRIKQQNLSHYNINGLWLNTAYGSHGIIYSLLASKHLSALVTNNISPLSQTISNAIHPARFKIRSLKK